MEYTVLLDGNNFTVTVDYEVLNTFIDSLIWEEGKYTEMYSLDVGSIIKDGFVRQVGGLKSLITHIQNNESLITDFVKSVEKKDNKFIAGNGYTIAIAKDICEYIDDESWKVLELRLEIINDYSCEMKFTYRTKSRK